MADGPTDPAPAPVRPGPDLDAGALMRRARRLRFRVRPRATLALAGAYHAARPGVGLTFAELKPYEPGDDVRHLDWNVTARQGRPYVRRYVEERALRLWLVVDVSASLRCGPPGRTRADRAAQAAALLAAAAVQNGDRVGLTLVSDRVEADVPAGTGPRHLAKVLRALVVTPPGAAPGTDLAAALPVARRRPRRLLLVLLSDFLTPPPAAAWRAALRGADQLALRLVDPADASLPPVGGLLALRDAETGRARLVDAGSRRVRAAYARAGAARAAAFRAWCEAVGASGHDLPTPDDPIGPLLRIMRERARSRRR
jgi:uncharacterized protein (DUF58 family)